MPEKDMNIFDRDYKNWIKYISSRFRRSQIKAATHVKELSFFHTTFLFIHGVV